jgi:hypothetical protein
MRKGIRTYFKTVYWKRLCLFSFYSCDLKSFSVATLPFWQRRTFTFFVDQYPPWSTYNLNNGRRRKMKLFRSFFLPIFTVLLISGLVYSQCNVYDDFSGTTINTGIWNIVSGSWSQNDQLTGSWGGAQDDQGNILLVNSLQPNENYTVEVDAIVTPSGEWDGHRWVLYNSPGNKYNLCFQAKLSYFDFEYRQNGSEYQDLVPTEHSPYFNTAPGDINHLKLVRTGNHFQCFLNNHLVFEFNETIFGGDVKIGLGCYLTATYDNFCLTRTTAIPTLTEWGLIIFGVVLIGFITWVFLKRRKVIGVRS